jgi:hypothetical protein
MFVLVAAALAGGATTTVTLWNYGIFLALACAPVGGSLLAFIAASLFSIMRGGPDYRRRGALGSLPVSLDSARN